MMYVFYQIGDFDVEEDACLLAAVEEFEVCCTLIYIIKYIYNTKFEKSRLLEFLLVKE